MYRLNRNGEYPLKHKYNIPKKPIRIPTTPVFILYVATVLWYTVLKRPQIYEIPQFEAFWSFRKWLAGDLRYGIQIAGNIIMFMPFGFLLCDLFYIWDSVRFAEHSVSTSTSSTSNLPAKIFFGNPVGSERFERVSKWLLILLLAFIYSLLIEILQLTLVRGLAEIDDLFSNTLGTMLGICSYEALRKLVENRRFGFVCTAIRGAFVIICFAVLIISRRSYSLKENSLSRAFCFQIDEASINGEQLTLCGFTFAYGRQHFTPRLVLHPMTSNDSIDLDIIYGTARPDVNRYFLCDFDYTNVGFTASGIVDPEAEYEVMIGWPLKKPVTTGVYILGDDVHRVAYGGKHIIDEPISDKEEDRSRPTEEDVISSADTEEYISTTTGEDVISSAGAEEYRNGKTGENVIRNAGADEKDRNLSSADSFKMPDLSNDFVTNGTLLVYRPDFHIWVFQYDGSLYWIADEGFNFEEDGTTKIQYQLWTTQIQNLPSKRLKNNHFWDTISGNFEKYELSGDFGTYRIMKRALPEEYSITSIMTGYYKDKKWIWASSFRPVYTF